jgi:hypothetical protein
MALRRRQVIALFWLLALGLAVGAVYVLSPGRPEPPPPPLPREEQVANRAFPPPPFSTSPFLNTGPDAQYIGSDACAKCHPANHKSYSLTAHSKALSDVDPAAEPPDGSFDHKPSGRSYRVYRKDGRLRHEEVMRTEDGREVTRVDLPVSYLVGSGHYSRTYLVEVEGFLHESPVTWYASKNKWGMSPGYDSPRHSGFERPVEIGCMSCHSGRVAEAGGSVHRLTFHEKAIGCESCHGPGSVHQDFHRSHKPGAGEQDFTIVNPRRLSRQLQEAICAACHLRGPATVAVRGRDLGDYRPGRPLNDYRIHYRSEAQNEQMSVVGHVEQLRLSPCYQRSGGMTCLTCHDPHAREKPPDPVAFYRQKCLECHTKQPCKLPPPARLQKQPADDCTACHMPRGDTDIPHIAFTHHRIGLHGSAPPARLTECPNLVPEDDISHLSEVDRRRNLGLAYLEASMNPTFAPYAGTFQQRAWTLLTDVRRAGLRDGLTTASLAGLSWPADPTAARSYAAEAIAAPDTPLSQRGIALTILAHADLADRDLPAAARRLEELVRFRRLGEDWRLLGKVYQAQNQPQKALTAFQTSLAIRPSRHILHDDIAEAYRRLGDDVRANEHRWKSQWLLAHHPE